MFALIILVSICIDFAEHAFILGFSVLRDVRGAIGIVGCVLWLGGMVICARVVSKGGVRFEGCLHNFSKFFNNLLTSLPHLDL